MSQKWVSPKRTGTVKQPNGPLNKEGRISFSWAGTVLNQSWTKVKVIPICTVRKVLADFAVCDWWHCCKALCDVKFSQIEEHDWPLSHTELSDRPIWAWTLSVFRSELEELSQGVLLVCVSPPRWWNCPLGWIPQLSLSSVETSQLCGLAFF